MIDTCKRRCVLNWAIVIWQEQVNEVFCHFEGVVIFFLSLLSSDLFIVHVVSVPLFLG